jgi:hypothetical protein
MCRDARFACVGIQQLPRIVTNKHADPRLVWLASVLAAAVFIVYVTHI